MSPYECSLEELIRKLSLSQERKTIIKGFLDLRKELCDNGIDGFQWLDGSFVENVEAQRGVPPNDIDVVTFVNEAVSSFEIHQRLPREILDSKQSKLKYSVDHYLIPLSSKPKDLVAITTYWFGLFSQRRRDHIRKGILLIELKDSQIEADYRNQGW